MYDYARIQKSRQMQSLTEYWNHSSWTGMKRCDSKESRMIPLGRHSFDLYFWLQSMTGRKHWTQTVCNYTGFRSRKQLYGTIFILSSSSNEHANKKFASEILTSSNFVQWHFITTQKLSYEFFFIHMYKKVCIIIWEMCCIFMFIYYASVLRNTARRRNTTEGETQYQGLWKCRVG